MDLKQTLQDGISEIVAFLPNLIGFLLLLLIGFVVGVVCAATALRSEVSARDMSRLLPTGYVRGVLACLVISGAVSVSGGRRR